MGRPATKGLTDNELLIMKSLWATSPLSVSEMVDFIKKKPKPAYTSVLTLVQTMEKKGYIRHIKEGKAFVYFPVLTKKNFEKKRNYRNFETAFQCRPLHACHQFGKERASDANRSR